MRIPVQEEHSRLREWPGQRSQDRNKPASSRSCLREGQGYRVGAGSLGFPSVGMLAGSDSIKGGCEPQSQGAWGARSLRTGKLQTSDLAHLEKASVFSCEKWGW